MTEIEELSLFTLDEKINNKTSLIKIGSTIHNGEWTLQGAGNTNISVNTTNRLITISSSDSSQIIDDISNLRSDLNTLNNTFNNYKDNDKAFRIITVNSNSISASSNETLQFKNGTNITMSVNDNEITINSTNTDYQVRQISTTDDYNLRVLLSGSANDDTHTGTVNKNSQLLYNPSTQTLQTINITSPTKELQIGNNLEYFKTYMNINHYHIKCYALTPEYVGAKWADFDIYNGRTNLPTFSARYSQDLWSHFNTTDDRYLTHYHAEFNLGGIYINNPTGNKGIDILYDKINDQWDIINRKNNGMYYPIIVGSETEINSITNKEAGVIYASY